MLQNDQQFNALVWECERKGLSYGQLMNQYSFKERAQVYAEYEKYLAEREARWQERHAQLSRPEHKPKKVRTPPSEGAKKP